MKDKKTLLTLLIVFVLAGASLAMPAFGPQRDKGPRAEKMVEKLAKELDLTKEQKDKFLAGEKQVVKEARELHKKNRELFDKVEKELVKEAPDSKAIYGYMQQISQNNTQVQFKRMEQIIQLRKDLTPEQKIKFEKMTKERKERAKKWMEKRGKRKPGDK